MTQLLTTAPVPAYPRNLASSLHRWFTRLGFEVSQVESCLLTQVQATWTDEKGQLFTVLYAHYHPASGGYTALFSLHVRPVGEAQAKCLVSATHIRRSNEVRLLLANSFYKIARQAALDAGVLQPA